ncbi:MAG: DNA mismatch repair endonuclease MutL [Verrucomicrobiales bacterium]|nr:DNA mismatch repair endonuclease MutL [Verrucomicrobiales bacterium]
MNRIRLLSEQVANQIAAGEVVERPASVVKELVENSIDAQATRIVVEIQAGGRSLMRVTDDGIGMSRDDALLSLERHATSKIQKAEDLSAITTMGFRGEALPSMASVSRMTLTTREAAAEEGTQIIINGGKFLEVKAAGCAPGTTIEVRQLFFNLPARRKFLRTEETERAHIQHYLTLAALAHPQIAFVLVQDGRMAWQLPVIQNTEGDAVSVPALRERMRALYGGQTALLPVDFSAETNGAANLDGMGEPTEPEALHVWGLIGAPGVSRATREEQHLFVNRRPVENRGLNYALIEGYHTALMKGRYPVCCLFLEIHPRAVDINIHPSKREIKFHREPVVRRVVTQAVQQALRSFHANTETQRNAPGAALPAPPESTTSVKSPGVANPAAEPAPALPREFSEVLPAQPSKPISEWPNSSHAPGSTTLGGMPRAIESWPARPVRETPLPQARTQPGEAVPLLHVPLRLVGVIGKLYVVLESDRGLVLLDQHAAHERILFEQMMNRLEQKDAPSQRLLLPETIELSPRDAQFLREQLSALNRLGVGLSEFGERTFLLDALPPFVKVSDARRFTLELVDELKATGEGVNSWRLGEHAITKTVCRHAVKANDPLAGPELEKLIEDLRRCAMPYTCPHGRPTLIEMNFRELERKFGRAQ